MKEDKLGLTAARCHEIQTALNQHNVPDFENIREIGIAARLSLHIQGLHMIDYNVLKPVCAHFFGMTAPEVKSTVTLLADIEFVRLKQEGKKIKAVLPTVPYYDELYNGLDDYINSELDINETEKLALTIVGRLARTPEKIDKLQNELGAEPKLFKRNIDIGKQGNFLVIRRCRGRDIIINPSYFAENSEIFADQVSATGAKSVAALLQGLRQYQGWPLRLIETKGELGQIEVKPEQISLLKRLAQDGIVKPPSIETAHSGLNYFMFTPTPSKVHLSTTKRDIYEKAMAIVAAIRQGQLLPQKYAINSPGAVLYKLKTELRLGKATTEFKHQYTNLVHLRIGSLIPAGNRFYEFRIIDTPANREALNIAYSLVSGEQMCELTIDDEARKALQSSQDYIDSIISAATLRQRDTIPLSEEQLEEYDSLILAGVK
jgi:hypothetical protein